MFRSLTMFAWCVGLSMTSYLAGAAPAAPRPLSLQEQSDLKYLVQHIGDRGRGSVDLSNPRSRAAYLALLARHGITPETRPHLFKTLASVGAETVQKQCEFPAAAEGPQNFRVVLDASGNADFSEVRAEALDSLVLHPEATPTDENPGSPQFVLDTLDVFDSGLDELLTSGEAEGYVGAEGSTFDPRLTVFQTPLGANPTKGPVTAVASFFYRTANGAHLPCLVVNTGLDHFVPKSMHLADPTNQKTKPGTPIVICINRANQNDVYQDCDYGPLMPGKGNPDARVKAVVSGSVAYYDPLAPFVQAGADTAPNPDGYLAVMPRNTGGACVLSPIQGAAFWGHLKVLDDHTLGFDWGRAADGTIDAGQAADFGPLCWQAVPNNHEWDLVLTLKTKTLNKAGKPTYTVRSSFVSEDPAIPQGMPNVALLPPLVLEFGCIEKGATVKMADGAQERIEDVRIGQRVIGASGAVFEVREKTTGTDNHFVEITVDSAHRALSVTPMHPIAILPKGAANPNAPFTFVPAKDLAIGDRIYVAGGHAPVPVSKVALVTSHQALQVFNLTLDPVRPAGAAGASNVRSFYADDILVGDRAMQGRLVAAAQAAAGTLPKRDIVGEERIDYEHWLRSRHEAAGGLPQ
jgi:hypothetical protein